MKSQTSVSVRAAGKEPEHKGASDYWLLHGSYYDFSAFVPNHPGGRRAIMLGKGRDCTALFESYHTNLPSEKLLEKYRITNVTPSPEEVEFTAGKGFQFKEEGFYRTIKRKAREYFKANGINHTKANFFGIFSFYLNLLAMIVFGWAAFVQGSIICALLHGVSRALLIIRPTHAASHYAFSLNEEFNQWAYRLCMAFAGTAPLQWTVKHVLAHHLDTNITPMDEDTMYPIKRILPGLDRLSFHKYQHYYMWLLYPFTTSFWTISCVLKLYPFFLNDVVYEGVMPVPHHNYEDWSETFGTLLFFVFHRMVLPFLVLPFDQALLVFIASEIGCSMWFALQFAVSHEVEECVMHTFEHKNGNDPEKTDKKTTNLYSQGCRKNDEDWGVHQVLSSHNYATDSLLALHLSGGLNLQIEHHLFPSVHYHHYPALSKIVRETCKEFGIPYVTSDSFLDALRRHNDLMKKMGSADKL